MNVVLLTGSENSILFDNVDKNGNFRALFLLGL